MHDKGSGDHCGGALDRALQPRFKFRPNAAARRSAVPNTLFSSVVQFAIDIETQAGRGQVRDFLIGASPIFRRERHKG